ncbi:hypothetical protein IW261DRAFT_1559952 [Armillaria novae-zelandiae]|uniref:Uncharacterized protein n=1 Tax=Armillaria novae-zelandiae TaxID=153914 RepID=A0AA39PMF7_9AGAR|nr:hypothetical protein IW261DRAFT_1559952 [Armillaria novae-zelandiae]
MQSNALVSNTSVDEATDSQFDQGGVLEKEEAHEATMAARAAKGGCKSEIKRERDVVLQPAAVADIDKEHEKKPAKMRTQWTNKDLPLSSHHLHVWQQKVVPRIIDWSATLADPFGSNNHLNFKDVIAQEWIRFFGNLQESMQYEGQSIKRVDHPAIYRVAMSAMRTYRSEIRKYTMACMDNLWLQEDMKQYDTVEHPCDWVQDMLTSFRFLYEFPDKMENCGAFHGQLIIEVFAFHINMVFTAMSQQNGGNYGDPAGAMALTCAAVRRALTLWKLGFNSLQAASMSSNGRQGAKNTPDSFKDDPWDKWDNIFAHTEITIKKKGLTMAAQLEQATGGINSDNRTKLLPSADDIDLSD